MYAESSIPLVEQGSKQTVPVIHPAEQEAVVHPSSPPNALANKKVRPPAQGTVCIYYVGMSETKHFKICSYV